MIPSSLNRFITATSVHAKAHFLVGSRIASYFFLVAMYFWLPFGNEEVSALVIAVAIASSLFLIQDIRYLRREINWVANAWILTIFLVLLIGCLWLTSSELPHFQSEAAQWYGRFGASLAILCTGAAIVEEVAFRRYLPSILGRVIPTNWAIFVSAVSFMLAHGFFSIHLFLAGVAYGILASHLRAIHAAIFIHATVNILGSARLDMVSRTNEEGLSSAIALGGSSALSQFLGIALLFVFMSGRVLYGRLRRKHHAATGTAVLGAAGGGSCVKAHYCQG